MVQVAEVVDAVIGGNTHRDVHALEVVAPNGTTLSTLAISNDEAGFADVLAWIAEHAPGPGSWSPWRTPAATGVGLARALAAAGLPKHLRDLGRGPALHRGQHDPRPA